METTIFNYEYKDLSVIRRNNKGDEWITTKNDKGDVIYRNNLGLEIKNDIQYNEDGSKIITNNFNDKYEYDKNNRLLSYVIGDDEHRYGYKNWSETVDIKETIETLNGEINSRIYEAEFDDNKIEITTNYHIGFENTKPNETYKFEVKSRLDDKRKKEFNVINDDFISTKLYDDKGNVIQEKTLVCNSTVDYKYDQNNNIVSENMYYQDKLIQNTVTENNYDDEDRLIQQKSILNRNYNWRD